MPIEKIAADAPEAKSADIVADNIAKLKALFPDLLTEGKDGVAVDVNVLKQLVGDRTVAETEEKYGLNWHGKRRARQLALTPSTGTLRPCPEESVDWEKTQNLMIEGDNLEVLKLLQKSYSGKVKLIYIDPPYNTGKDFVYPDDFQDNIKNYLELTGQVKSGKKMVANTEASGRFHTDWLNMMLPRIALARTLLKNDGVLFISIHHKELSNLLRLCSEIFGEENFVGLATWKARVKPVNVGDAKYRPQGETEFVLIYQKTATEGKFQPLYTGGVRNYPHSLNGRKYRLQTILKSNRGGNFRSTMSFEIDGYSPPEGQRWQGGEEEIKRLNKEGYLEFREATPFRRYFEDEEGAEHDPFYCFMENDWSSTSETGKFELNELLGNDHGFDTVKPTRLIKTLLQSLTKPDAGDIVLDFFAGSGTTAQSAIELNADDNGNRRFIMVQFPEPLSPENEDQKSSCAFCDKNGLKRSIAEITKERIRRASRVVKAKTPLFTGDFGFRVYKLDSSNIREWDPKRDDLATTLEEHAEHLKTDRSEADVLTEILLKLGLDLCVPIEQRVIGGVTVHSIGAGALFACLPESITRDQVKPLAQGILAWREELKVAVKTEFVFRDNAFADDVAKTNLAAYLEQNLPESQRGRIRSL